MCTSNPLCSSKSLPPISTGCEFQWCQADLGPESLGPSTGPTPFWKLAEVSATSGCMHMHLVDKHLIPSNYKMVDYKKSPLWILSRYITNYHDGRKRRNYKMVDFSKIRSWCCLTAHILGLTTRDDFRVTIVLLEYVRTVSQFHPKPIVDFFVKTYFCMLNHVWIIPRFLRSVGFGLFNSMAYLFSQGLSLDQAWPSAKIMDARQYQQLGSLGSLISLIWRLFELVISWLHYHLASSHANIPSCQLDIDQLIKSNASSLLVLYGIVAKSRYVHVQAYVTYTCPER